MCMTNTDDNERVMTTIRLPKKVLRDSAADAKKRGWSRTRLIEELLVAHHENRITVAARPGPSAFPADELGSPENPAHITFPTTLESP
jgi:hypothetical protein